MGMKDLFGTKANCTVGICQALQIENRYSGVCMAFEWNSGRGLETSIPNGCQTLNTFKKNNNKEKQTQYYQGTRVSKN